MEPIQAIISGDKKPECAKRNSRATVNPLARAIRKVMESGEVYKTDPEVLDLLIKNGCAALTRNPDENKRLVREVLVRNSKTYGRRASDDTFYLFSRLREIA